MLWTGQHRRPKTVILLLSLLLLSVLSVVVIHFPISWLQIRPFKTALGFLLDYDDMTEWNITITLFNIIFLINWLYDLFKSNIIKSLQSLLHTVLSSSYKHSPCPAFEIWLKTDTKLSLHDAVLCSSCVSCSSLFISLSLSWLEHLFYKPITELLN